MPASPLFFLRHTLLPLAGSGATDHIIFRGIGTKVAFDGIVHKNDIIAHRLGHIVLHIDQLRPLGICPVNVGSNPPICSIAIFLKQLWNKFFLAVFNQQINDLSKLLSSLSKRCDHCHIFIQHCVEEAFQHRCKRSYPRKTNLCWQQQAPARHPAPAGCGQ